MSFFDVTSSSIWHSLPPVMSHLVRLLAYLPHLPSVILFAWLHRFAINIFFVFCHESFFLPPSLLWLLDLFFSERMHEIERNRVIIMCLK